MSGLKVFDGVEDHPVGYGAKRYRDATDDEVRAAVVPLLDLEAAAIAEYENRGYLAETWGDNDSWVPYVDDTRAAAKRVVYAALGLGEEA